MNFLLGLQVGLKEILAHKFRSFLTMLGVILGVASLVSMFALTEGIARGMRAMLEARGGVETVNVDNKEVSESLQELAYISPGRTMADVDAMGPGAPLVDRVTPEVRLNGAAITVGGQTMRTGVTGTLPNYFEMAKLAMEYGRMIADLDVEEAHRVVVLGDAIVKNLWGESIDPVGKIILINQRPFTVIGKFALMETEEQKRKRESFAAMKERRERRGREPGRRWDPFFQQNNSVVVPISTMFHEFKSAQVADNSTEDKGPDYKLDALSFRVKDLGHFEDAITQVQNILVETHRGIDDFSFNTREDWFDTIESSVRATRLSGGLIAGISLLVGGIGITNIMLASITERVREIGVRRAVGATGRDIFVQIVVESVVIGVIGGLIGLATSQGMIKLLVTLSPEENVPVVTLQAIVISFAFAVAIGILSGLYPAWKAARLDPIEALRYG